MAGKRKNGKTVAEALNGGGAVADAVAEEEYRKRFEPVAPWKRDNIPDYGPLKDHQHVVIFILIGIVATIGYEYTDYFDEINRWLAYLAIWFPLWFRLLGRVSPQLTEEEMDEKEREGFLKELERIQMEAETLDD